MVMMVMMVVMMMVMMVMVRMRFAMLYHTLHFTAFLTFRLKLERDVTYSVLAELLANGFLYLTAVAICHNVHGCVILLTIHAPNVNVVNAKNSVDVENVILYLVDLNASRHLFKEKLQHFFEIFHGIDENKNGNTYRHNGVDSLNAVNRNEFHNERAHKDYNPSENVLKHV